MNSFIDELKTTFLNNVVEVTKASACGQLLQEVPVNDPTIQKLAEVADAHGCSLRFTNLAFAVNHGNRDLKRINIKINKGDDGKFRISQLTLG